VQRLPHGVLIVDAESQLTEVVVLKLADQSGKELVVCVGVRSTMYEQRTEERWRFA